MRTPQTERKAITQIREYILNGFPVEFKDQLRAEKRRLEYRLDKAEYLTRLTD